MKCSSVNAANRSVGPFRETGNITAPDGNASNNLRSHEESDAKELVTRADHIHRAPRLSKEFTILCFFDVAMRGAYTMLWFSSCSSPRRLAVRLDFSGLRLG